VREATGRIFNIFVIISWVVNGITLVVTALGLYGAVTRSVRHYIHFVTLNVVTALLYVVLAALLAINSQPSALTWAYAGVALFFCYLFYTYRYTMEWEVSEARNEAVKMQGA
jgi:Ca2+/Na+ antiporter